MTDLPNEINFIPDAECDHCGHLGAFFFPPDEYCCVDCMTDIDVLEDEFEYYDDLTGWFV